MRLAWHRTGLHRPRRWHCVAALLALACVAPAGAAAADLPGLSMIGPPETLRSVVFAPDGTVFGTTRSSWEARGGDEPALWRSRDGGRRWQVVYRAPTGWLLTVTAAVDSSLVYVQQEPLSDAYFTTNPGLGARPARPVLRVDLARAVVMPTPFITLAGIDAAGTAYGTTWVAGSGSMPPSYSVVRCPRRADGCTQSPMPAGYVTYLAVDPLSVGVLAYVTTVGETRQLELSADGGATWTPGAVASPTAACACGPAFAGPRPRTLAVLSATLLVSHDAGATWATSNPAPQGGGVLLGSAPAGAITTGGSRMQVRAEIVSSGDDGASYATVALPSPLQVIAVDPTDPNHLFAGDSARDVDVLQSWDGGRTLAPVVDARFGSRAIVEGRMAGTGRVIYALSGPRLWSSRDRGASWTRDTLAGEGTSLLVSRDDPLSAYMVVYAPNRERQVLRTRDGGATWAPIPGAPEISAIVPGGADELSGPAGLSHDGGLTWSADPGACYLQIASDATSSTGARATCTGSPLGTLPVTATTPWVSGSPDAPGMFSFVDADHLGDIGADGTWTSLLAPTEVFGPAGRDPSGYGAWPSRAGTTAVAGDETGVAWVRRGTGRWWRLQAGGRNAGFIGLLDATHALVSFPTPRALTSHPDPLGVLDLATPAVEPPAIVPRDGRLACVVPWSRADADTTAYAWLRDGAVIAGATRQEYAPVAQDRGHDLACAATATTAWGSVKRTSELPHLVPGARLAPAPPRLTGRARVGRRLTCSARSSVTWLRDGRAVGGRRGRTITLVPRDAGHRIACRTRLPGGLVATSRALRIAATTGAP